MRKIILCAICFAVTFLCAAQNSRVVNGSVLGRNGNPIAGATVSATSVEISVRTDGKGMFSITIPDSVEELRAECQGYHPLTLPADDQFVEFRMTIDPDYASKAYRYAAIELKLAQDAERRMIDDAKAQVKEKRATRTRQIDSLYNLMYRNSGLVQSFEVSYGYQLAHGEVAYKNLGLREYGSLHPVEFNYTLAYRFHNFYSLGIGAGVQYQLVNLCRYPDVFDPIYEGYEDFTPLNVPVFVNLKAYLSRGVWQPLVSVSGGVYFPNMEGMADIGAGLNVRVNRVSNIYFLLSIRTTPYGEFRKSFVYYTKIAWTPSFKLGYTF